MTGPVSRIDALIGETQALVRKAKERGDLETARSIHKRLILPLSDLRLRAIQTSLQGVAVELNRLSDLLGKARQDLERDVDSFFLGEIARHRDEVDAERDRVGAELRFGRASEDPERERAARTSAPEPATARDATVAVAVADVTTGDAGTSDAAARSETLPREKAQYSQRFEEMEIRQRWAGRADAVVDMIIDPDSGKRYRAVERLTGVPWWFTGLLHSMECSCDFRRHLHNGDSLSARTVNIPANRPPIWEAGMSWEDSAVDALAEEKNLDEVQDWSIGAILEMMEKWNGLGYRTRGIFTPFLWSGSAYYEKGKFVRDHVFDPEKISDQVGAAVVLRRMRDRDVLGVSRDSAMARPKTAAIVGSVSLAAIDTGPFGHAAAELTFPGRVLKRGAGGTGDTAKNRMAVRRVQEWCGHHGMKTFVDGDFAGSTLEAVTRFQKKMALEPSGSVDEATWGLMTRPLRLALETRAPEATLNETVIRIAETHIEQGPVEIGGNNLGPWVRLYMDGKDGEEQLWCAGFVCFIVAQACRDLKMAMPFKRQVGVDALVKDAKDAGRFIPEASLSDPATRPSLIPPGTLFVVRDKNDANDWTHVGFVTSANRESFDTLEGNTNGENRDGANAKVSNRGYGFKDFIRLL